MSSKPSKQDRQQEPEPFDFPPITVPQCRPESDIMRDLEALCALPGYAHALAFMCWEANFVRHSVDELLPDDLDKMYSRERLSRSELSLLQGLMVKSPLNLEWPSADSLLEYVNKTNELLEELHSAMFAPFAAAMNESRLDPQKDNPLTVGKVLREAIFYAGEAAYFFQYRDFSPDRYHDDTNWLLQNKGFSPENVQEALKGIAAIQEEKIKALATQVSIVNIHTLSLLRIFTFTAEEISQASQLQVEQVTCVLKAFSPKSIPCNHDFCEVGAFNEVSAYPFIPIGDKQYLLFQPYNLAESSYETPFFWMSRDTEYVDQAATHRGQFTERFATNRLKAVLGAEHVYTNVEIKRGKNRIGEIDVLAIYANRAIILEAKSKRLTTASRSGDDEQIKRDFEAAVQKAYDQSFKNSRHLIDVNCTLYDEAGNKLEVRREFAEIFILCVVSDYYPALAQQADQFLKKQKHDIVASPYVTDIFFLDVLCELLDTPLHLFNYLNRRLRYADKVKSENEMTILSFHLSQNLWFEPEFDYVQVGDEFSVYVDTAMLVRRDGRPGNDTPEGLLTRPKSKFFDLIIEIISNTEKDYLLDLGYLLLGISEESAIDFSTACETIVELAQTDKRHHNFTMVFGSAGITVHANFFNRADDLQRLYVHCEKSKYRSGADRWFGILLNPSENGYVQVIFEIKSPWEEQKEMNQFLEKSPNDRPKNVKQAFRRQMNMKKNKIGRNAPCPCGSGKKYKKCCLNNSR